MRITSRRKFAGLAYTKPGGKLEQPMSTPNAILAIGEKYGLKVVDVQQSKPATNRVTALAQASANRPIVQLKGPKSGATKTGVSVTGPGQIVVEGKTYDDLYAAADYIGITLLKMLCGSGACPDAAACATGG